MFSCFFVKQKTAYEMRISDWSSDVCSSDLPTGGNAMLIFNEELRITLPRSFGLVLFFDHGNVWLDHQDVRFSDIKSTTGIRSEEPRVGKECVSTSRSRWSQYI